MWVIQKWTLNFEICWIFSYSFQEMGAQVIINDDTRNMMLKDYTNNGEKNLKLKMLGFQYLKTLEQLHGKHCQCK